VNWTEWDPAPVVLAGAGVVVLLFAQAFARLRRRRRADHASWSRVALFGLALAIGLVALVSPLDELGDSYLLSGHMLQHVLIGDAVPALALVALRGPLLFFLLPSSLLRALAPRLRGLLGFLLRPRNSLAAWAAVFAAWHVPAAYDYALGHQIVHDLEHLSFLAAGLLVWTQLIDPACRHALRIPQRLGYAFVLFVFGAFLGTVLALSAPLYPSYAEQADRIFELSPFRDQQLAGVVMIAEQLLSLSLCAAFLLAQPRRSRYRRPSLGSARPAAHARPGPATPPSGAPSRARVVVSR